MGSPKEAALYFERVFPIDFAFPAFAGAFPTGDPEDSFERALNLEIPFRNEGFYNSVLKNLLANDDAAIDAYVNLFALSFCFWTLPILAFCQNREELAAFEEKINPRASFARAGLDYDQAVREAFGRNSFNLGEFVEKNIDKYEIVLRSAGLDSAPTWRGNFQFMEQYLRGTDTGDHHPADYAVAIRDLDLIDPLKTSWGAILEFRNDKDSFAALRDFRVFFVENFSNKDAAFVSDKLNSLIDAYATTVKFWGFETAKKSMAIAVSQQGVASSAVGSLAMALTGAPISAVAAAGAVITLGNCALEFGGIMVDTKKAELTRPLRYLSKLSSLSESGSAGPRRKPPTNPIYD